MTDYKILLVDDDQGLLEMLVSIFRRAGYTYLLTASTGEDALRIREKEQPDMIVLDVMMPDMDGFAVLRAIRRTSRVPRPDAHRTRRGGRPHRGTGNRRGRLSGQAVFTKRIASPGERDLKPRLPKSRRDGGTFGFHCGSCQRDGMEKRRAAVADRQRIPAFRKIVSKCGEDRHHRDFVRDDLRRILAGIREHAFHAHPASAEKIEENPSRPVSLLTVKGLGYRLNLKEGSR